MFDIKVVTNVISSNLLEMLYCDFENSVNQVLPGRRFNTNLGYAKKILLPIIKEYLPGDWIVDGGNYFETTRPYRLHCDTGKDQIKKLYYNIVIPIKLWANNYNPNLNKLIITNQTWTDDAAFFVKGDNSKDEYNKCITEYDNVGNLSNSTDKLLIDLCPHLNVENLLGFNIKDSVNWNPGDMILFKRHFIHTTSDWRLSGVYKKLGLSFFTSYK